jgi:hypothetical protein
MTSRTRDTILGALRDEELIGVLDRYSGKEEGHSAGVTPREVFSQGVSALSATRLVMPVIGVQGSGKSTFLNALLFTAPVLPIDADETTSVPTEVAYTPGPEPRARVCFRDGKEREVEPSEDGLREFVHNALNPGNEKGVDRVVVSSPCRLLADGLVLVDLPGVGSLTAANLATTQAYLRESASMIYLLRTVPPLTRSESIFVAGVWPSLPGALFVQNRWDDESDLEVKEGRSHNVEVLSDLARKHHVPLTGPPAIQVVNAYRAQAGALGGNEKAAADSGMDACRAHIAQATRSWRTRLFNLWQRTILEQLRFAGERATGRLAALEQDEDLARKKAAAERLQFECYLNDLKARADRARSLLTAFEGKGRRLVEAWGREAGAELRNRMRDIMRSGTVDGANLAAALRDHQGDQLDRLLEEYQTVISDFHVELLGIFSDIDCPAATRPGVFWLFG